jgi:hypothetical protein
MREYIKLVEEFLHSFVVPYRVNNDGLDTTCDLYKNPTAKELKHVLGKNQEARAFIINDYDIIVWNVFDSLHYSVKKELKLPDTVIPINLFCNKLNDHESYAQVTDTIKNTPLWHDKTVAEKIKNNAFMKRHFKNIEISYYDESIYGDWKDI